MKEVAFEIEKLKTKYVEKTKTGFESCKTDFDKILVASENQRLFYEEVQGKIKSTYLNNNEISRFIDELANKYCIEIYSMPILKQ